MAIRRDAASPAAAVATATWPAAAVPVAAATIRRWLQCIVRWRPMAATVNLLRAPVARRIMQEEEEEAAVATIMHMLACSSSSINISNCCTTATVEATITTAATIP